MSLITAAIQGLPPLPKSLSGFLNFNRESLHREASLRGPEPRSAADLGHHQLPPSSTSGTRKPSNNLESNRLSYEESSSRMWMETQRHLPAHQVLEKRSSRSLGPGHSGRFGGSQSSGRSSSSSPRGSVSSSSNAESPVSARARLSSAAPSPASSGSTSSSQLPKCPYSLWPGGMNLQLRSAHDSSFAFLTAKPGSLEANLALLRKELITLRQTDMKLLCQLWTLGEKIDEIKKQRNESTAQDSTQTPVLIPEEEEEEGDDDDFSISEPASDFEEFYANPINDISTRPPSSARPSGAASGTIEAKSGVVYSNFVPSRPRMFQRQLPKLPNVSTPTELLSRRFVSSELPKTEL